MPKDFTKEVMCSQSLCEKLKDLGMEQRNYFNLADQRYLKNYKTSLSQALKWLRDEKKLFITSNYSSVDKLYWYIIINLTTGERKESMAEYNTFEDAEFAGINEVCLEWNLSS